MPSYSKLRQKLQATLKQRLGEMGFIKQFKDFADYYVKSSAEGHHGVQCKIDARYDISLNLRFGLRFDVVSRAMQFISDEIVTSGRCGVTLDGKTEAYIVAIAPDFECFFERLVGLSDWTADRIETEAELGPLCGARCNECKSTGFLSSASSVRWLQLSES